jgi:hypothetical protein
MLAASASLNLFQFFFSIFSLEFERWHGISKGDICHAFFRFQFIPQMIFLNSLFGYLSLLIIVKWSTGSQADLYHVMIYMFLSPTDELGENELFPRQKTVQVDSYFLLPFTLPFMYMRCSHSTNSFCIFGFQLVLLLLALVSVPWMLLPKPFLLKKQHEAVWYCSQLPSFSIWLKFIYIYMHACMQIINKSIIPRSLVCVYVCTLANNKQEHCTSFSLSMSSDCKVSPRGTKVNRTHHFRALRSHFSWRQTMIHMVTRNLNSVKFSYIRWYIPLSLYLEQSQTQLPIFVYGPSGMPLGNEAMHHLSSNLEFNLACNWYISKFV